MLLNVYSGVSVSICRSVATEFSLHFAVFVLLFSVFSDRVLSLMFMHLIALTFSTVGTFLNVLLYDTAIKRKIETKLSQSKLI